MEYHRLVLDNKITNNESLLLVDLTTIENEITGLTRLMEDVLVLEKVESHSLKLKLTEISLVNQLKGVIARLQKDDKFKYIPILKVQGKQVVILGDPKYLDLVFTNLIGNAIKYSKENGSAPIVTITYLPDSVKVSVKDFGIGIPKKNHGKIFSTFFRADNVAEIEGTGLGLSIVKKLVEFHNGIITFESEENEGTEMIVTLPMIKPQLKPVTSINEMYKIN